MDHAGTNLTLTILSCPPASCLPFGCPGHEYSRKGLQGCVETETYPVGAQLVITFTVFDKETPPGSSSVDRLLRVVSPCSGDEIHCPALEQACGTTSCEVREALLGPEETESEFFILRFDDAVLALSLIHI